MELAVAGLTVAESAVAESAVAESAVAESAVADLVVGKPAMVAEVVRQVEVVRKKIQVKVVWQMVL